MFFDIVVAAHPELFDGRVLQEASLTGESGGQAAAARVATYLHDVAPSLPRMRELSNSIHRDLQTYARDFARTFPDYAPRTPVYFTVSLFSFDGATRTVGNATALLFGIDGIARFHGPDADPEGAVRP